MTYTGPNREDIKQELIEAINSSFAWELSGKSLLESHSILWNTSNDKKRVAIMLLGMALECYIKKWYLENVGFIHDGKKQRLMGRHDLSEMAKNIGLCVSESEDIIFKKLTLYIKAYGRYPAPLDLNESISDLRIGDEIIPTTYISFNADEIDITISYIKMLQNPKI